jgi:hypothetical protein
MNQARIRFGIAILVGTSATAVAFWDTLRTTPRAEEDSISTWAEFRQYIADLFKPVDTSEDAFARLQSGMRRVEVEAILGSADSSTKMGMVSGRSGAETVFLQHHLTWRNSEAQINVVFSDSPAGTPQAVLWSQRWPKRKSAVWQTIVVRAICTTGLVFGLGLIAFGLLDRTSREPRPPRI